MCNIMVGCRSCTYPSIHLFMALPLEITVRLCVVHISKLSRKKTFTHVLGSLVRTTENGRGAVPVLTPVPSEANHSSFTSCRFQTGGMGASSWSSNASAMAHSMGSSGAPLDVLGEEHIVGIECRGLFGGFFEVGIAVGTQWTATQLSKPCSRRRGLMTGVATPCSSRWRRVSRRGRSGQEWRDLASGCSS